MATKWEYRSDFWFEYWRRSFKLSETELHNYDSSLWRHQYASQQRHPKTEFDTYFSKYRSEKWIKSVVSGALFLCPSDVNCGLMTFNMSKNYLTISIQTLPGVVNILQFQYSSTCCRLKSNILICSWWNQIPTLYEMQKLITWICTFHCKDWKSNMTIYFL